jgi:signal transduction histidine kinase
LKPPAAPEGERLLEIARLAQLGRLASAVAHDAATPLASIALRAETLQRKAQAAALPPDAAEAFARHLTTIHEEAFRANRILDALRGSQAAPGALDVSALARAAAAAAAHHAAGHGARIETEIEAGLRLPRASGGRLLQALLALLLNAVEATPRGGAVRLAAERRPGGVGLRVEDDGPGLPPEIAARLFEPFNTTKPPEQGLGLGLYLCERVARDHGATLAVERREAGGTRVELVLPAEAPA